MADLRDLIIEKNQAFATLRDAELWITKKARGGDVPHSWRMRRLELVEAYGVAKRAVREANLDCI